MKQCYRSVLNFDVVGLAFPFMSADANVSPLDMRSKKSFWKSLCNQNVNISSQIYIQYVSILHAIKIEIIKINI